MRKALPLIIKIIQQNQVSKLLSVTKNFLCLSLVLSLPISVQSCSGGRIDPFDFDTGLTRNEAFDTMIKKRKPEKKEEANKAPHAVPIPKMSKLIVSPPRPVIGGDRTISFSATDQVPLKDVLIEFGRMVQIDVDVDPNISGGIIINAKNRPLKEVIDRIATLGGLRYTYQNGVLHFESDAPYMKSYHVDYLSGGSLWTDVESNISSIMNAENAASGTATTTTSAASSSTSNKSAGIISIFGTDRQHKAVSRYLADVEKQASAQVIIEAKVVEVKLHKEYSSGIDWDRVGGGFSTSNGYVAPGSSGAGAIDIVLTGTELTLSATAIEKFGIAKTISSPRIHAINNQKATLNFSDKLVYFQVQQTQSNTSTTGGTTALVASTVSSTKLEENVGVSLEITPSINLKTNEITMNVKPKLSVFNGWVEDPASPRDADGNVTIVNQVPVIQARELETYAKIQSGNILVIGGLMKDESVNNDSGVPLIGRIPVIGWLFKAMSRNSAVTETVIFIKATIVNSGSQVEKVDRDIQKNFDPTIRPFQ